MAFREFKDENGRIWCAWDTTPTSQQVRPEFLQGWLTFESAGEKRRLAPVPAGWDAYDVERLRMMLRGAEPGVT